MDMTQAITDLVLGFVSIYGVFIGLRSVVRACLFSRRGFDKLQEKLKLPSIRRMDSGYKLWVLLGYATDLLTEKSTRKKTARSKLPLPQLRSIRHKKNSILHDACICGNSYDVWRQHYVTAVRQVYFLACCISESTQHVTHFSKRNTILQKIDLHQLTYLYPKRLEIRCLWRCYFSPAASIKSLE